MISLKLYTLVIIEVEGIVHTGKASIQLLERSNSRSEWFNR